MSSLSRSLSALNVLVYRVSGGRAMGHFFGGARILLLTTTGRRSGRPRTVPLLFLEDGDRLVVVGSKGGAAEDPVWVRNLEAVPAAKVQLGARRFAVASRMASAEEKARYWPRLVALYPPYEAYQRRTARQIPLIVLTPV